MIEFASMKRTVVCFGDSITRGLVSANYVEMLAQRLEPQGFRFINAGVNNDHTYNLLQRMEHVITHQPDIVTLLIGTNDVIGTLSHPGAVYNRIRKHLPRWPGLAWSYSNLVEILHCLKNETQARIGVASIPVLGEDLTSRPIQVVKTYNSRIQEIAAREGVSYIPVFERQVDFLKQAGVVSGRPFRGSVGLTLEFTWAHFIHHEPFDSFSARKGFKLLIDSVHMNTQGAHLIADEMEKFLQNS
jgi:acyl-CoA thioesterase I